jgi:class 3 adenylate cyclase
MEPNPNIEDGIYYIVLADLVGSTKFGAKSGNEWMRIRVNAFAEAACKAIKHAKMTQNSGQFFKTIGDGVLLLFSHFPDVAQWKVEFDGLLNLSQIHHKPRLKARICAHVGEIRFEKADASALAINQLCKMEKRVRTEDIVVTDLVRQLALPSLVPQQCSFQRYTRVRLDGYPRPVQLHRLNTKGALGLVIDKTYRAKQRKEEAQNQRKADGSSSA